MDERLGLVKVDVDGNRPGTGYVEWSVRVQGPVGIGYGIIYPESRAREASLANEGLVGLRTGEREMTPGRRA